MEWGHKLTVLEKKILKVITDSAPPKQQSNQAGKDWEGGLLFGEDMTRPSMIRLLSSRRAPNESYFYDLSWNCLLLCTAEIAWADRSFQSLLERILMIG